MNRKERIELAISKGYTCNPETGEVFNKNDRKLGNIRKDKRITFTVSHKNKSYNIRVHQFIWY